MLDHCHRKWLNVNIDVKSRRPLVMSGPRATGEFSLAGFLVATRRKYPEMLFMASVNLLEEAGGRGCG